MRSFYTFSGMRFILFDAEYNCLISYPEKDCDFCAMIKEHKTRHTNVRKATGDLFWEIAQSVGFPDYNYFSRVYKKIYSKTPKESCL